MNIYLCLRYVVFALFIICNAIIASVSVWNLSLAQSAGTYFPVDAYLIFVGSSGLAVIFTIIFVELARRNAVTGRIWFECTWVGLFWMLELAGAAALSATEAPVMCSKHFIKNHKKVLGLCVSTRVLIAFTWVCTIILLCYFLLLVVLSGIRHKDDPRVWQCSIRHFPSFETRRLQSAPPTPTAATLPRFASRAPIIVAPKPRRPPPPDLIESYRSGRSGLSPEYDIEHLSTPALLAGQPVPPIPAAPPPMHRFQSTREAFGSIPAVSLYPTYVQSSLVTQPSRTQPPPPPPSQSQSYMPPSPPPLGNWPRADVLSQPSHPKRKPAPEMSEASGVGAGAASSPPSSSPPRSRPTGPRKRSLSGDNNRPPPLDLSKISSFKEPTRR